MKFAHMADCHIGGWSEQLIKELGMEAFRRAIGICIERGVDFILISGDLFNTAIPQIDLIREVTIELRKLKDKSIPVYIIAGSHDFSPSGKTMLEVLEKAGLCRNVARIENQALAFTIDEKTGVKITGMLGKKGGLEKLDYETLQKENLESEEGFKVFMFHTALEEFKPESLANMTAQPAASLPKNFNYYAGGHVHYIFDTAYGNGKLVFPGALFPNNFKELEQYSHGGFYLVDDSLGIEYVPVKVKDVISWKIDANGQSPDEVTESIFNNIKQNETSGSIITIRIEGTLREGKPSDIPFREIFSRLENAYFIMKNTSKLKVKGFEELRAENGSVEEIEKKLLKEHCSKESPGFTEEEQEFLTKRFMDALDKEKAEGEKNADFEKRVISDCSSILGIQF